MTEPHVVVFPGDNTACGFLRVIWPAEILAARGRPVECRPKGHQGRLQGELVQWPNGTQHLRNVVDPGGDVLLFQRPLSRIWFEAAQRLKAAGKHIVVELDDDLKAVSPRNGFYSAVHPRYSPEANWTWLERFCALADRLVCTSDALARRYGARAGDVRIVRNYVPERYLAAQPAEPSDGLLVGWPGSLGAHPDDLQTALRGVVGACQGADARLRLIGTAEGELPILHLPEGLASLRPWVSLEGYPAQLACLDVGIAPLADTTFNRAKSWLKPLDLAAAGVPVVMSPSAEYCELHRLGIGRLADKPREWRRHLGELLASPGLRAEEGAAGQRIVKEQGLTLEERAEEFWAAWSEF